MQNKSTLRVTRKLILTFFKKNTLKLDSLSVLDILYRFRNELSKERVSLAGTRRENVRLFPEKGTHLFLFSVRSQLS